MDLPQAISAAKDVVLAVAAAVTAFVAVNGIKKWRKEIEGRAGFETARALGRASYRLRDELFSCRSPLISGAEYPDGFFDAKNRSPQEKAQGTAHVYKKRWETVSEAVAEFDVQALEAEALWGGRVRERTDELRACVVALRVAIEENIDNDASGGRNFAQDKAFGLEMRRAISGTPTSKDNPLSARIIAAVASIEEELKMHLGRA